MSQSSDLKVKVFFDILAQTSSILEKKKLLAEKKDDRDVRSFLDFLLNPYFPTGISEKRLNKPVTQKPTLKFASFYNLMTHLRITADGSDWMIANVQAFLNDVEDEGLQKFYVGIITKTLRLGCDAKTVNQAFGCEFIPLWEVQQAYRYEKVKLNEGEWFSLSEKLNGVRGTFLEGKLISRQGKEFSGLVRIINDIYLLMENISAYDQALFPGAASADDWVLDGELIRNNSDWVTDNENFRLTTGILNQEDGDKNSIQFVIFDILPKAEFLQGRSQQRYKERLKTLKLMAKHIKSLNERFLCLSLRVVDTYYSGTDQSVINRFLQTAIMNDKEGLMLNRDARYLRKRNNGILKIKQFYTVDLPIIDFEEGSGRLKDMLGAFVVRYKDNVLHVGTGMTDEQRLIFWNDRENLVGRVIEVKYKEESHDKETGKPSLQFPVFVQLRELGKEESYD